MEGQNKIGGDGGEEGKGVKAGGPRSLRSFDLLLRVLGLGLTLAAAVVLGVARETEVVPLKVFPNMPPLNVPVPAKWHYLSAFVYLVVSNAIAGSYAAFSLGLSVANCMSGRKGLASVIIALDLLMVALLFSSGSAAAAIGVIGYRGNSHVGWTKVCNVFDKFCRHVATSVLLCLLGALAFLLLALLAALGPRKKSN